jgi:chemotaxis protein methyltransferase CheR
MEYSLSDNTFLELSGIIEDRTGIHIPVSKKYLVENRLIRVLEENNLKGYDEYLYLLKYSPNGREYERLYDAITTNETFFFREPLQFDLFVDHIVPRAIEARGGERSLRVWSAASSSGEEPYTLSMVMKERRPDVNMDIIGSDISNKVLAAAERAVYSSYSVRNVPENYMGRYFQAKGRDFVLDPSVRKAVRFRNFNLLTERPGMDFMNLDAVFCRNVLIYFDIKTKQQVVSMLYDSLRPGGVLIIGSSESLHNVTRAFRPVTIDKVVIYEKR